MHVVVRKVVLAQIHWFSIINSCVTVLLLTGFLATILMRVLKNDFVKYTRDDEAGASCLLAACSKHKGILKCISPIDALYLS